MEKVNGWREVIRLSVVGDSRVWSLNKLERVLGKAIILCATKCIEDNGGDIFTTLSGGIDSSFCVAVMRQAFPKTPIHTFTCGGNYKHPDILAARFVSKIFYTSHFEFIPGPNCVKRAEKEFARFFPKAKDLGDVGVFYVYKNIAKFHKPKSVICHDGIDELLGGYWKHRELADEQQKIQVFCEFWNRLECNHLWQLDRTAAHFGISVILPYLQIPVVKFISGIPVHERTSHEVSKIPLREIAKKYLPHEVITRPKKGFCDALKVF